MQKKAIFVLLFIILPSWVDATTLTEVIQHTLQTNPEVLMTVSNRHAIAQQLKQVKAGYLPNIELTGGYGRERSDNVTTRRAGGEVTLTRQEIGLSLSQILFDGFKLKHKIAQQNYLVNAAAYRIQKTSENIALLTAEVFLEILRRRDLVELSKDNVVIHQKMLDQIRILVESGAGRQADVQQSASRLALAKSSLVNAQGNLRNTEINYRRVTGELPKTLSKPDLTAFEVALPSSAENSLDLAIEYHPALQIAHAELEAAQAVHQQAGAAFLPHLNLELGITDNSNLDGVDGDNDDINAMLKMRYNLYRGGADQARLQEAAERIGTAKEQIRHIHRLIEEDTLLSWNSLITVRARLDYLNKHVKSTEEVLESYKEQFKLGQRSLLDVLDSENELFNARTSLVSAQYAEQLSLLKVLESVGLLLKTLDIQPSTAAQIEVHP